jgi:hypothetical protein
MDDPARRSQWNLATQPEPVVTVHALRALVADWQAESALFRAAGFHPTGFAVEECAQDLRGLCDAADAETHSR